MVSVNENVAVRLDVPLGVQEEGVDAQPRSETLDRVARDCMDKARAVIARRLEPAPRGKIAPCGGSPQCIVAPHLRLLAYQR